MLLVGGVQSVPHPFIRVGWTGRRQLGAEDKGTEGSATEILRCQWFAVRLDKLGKRNANDVRKLRGKLKRYVAGFKAQIVIAYVLFIYPSAPRIPLARVT